MAERRLTEPLGHARRAALRAERGFTLIELLVSISIMAVLALLSWRSVNQMQGSQQAVQQRMDGVWQMQTALAQWSADWDAVQPSGVAGVPAANWDGWVLRLTRRDGSEPAAGLRVVAWVRRSPVDGGQWVRWQSPPLRERAAVADAWARAEAWARGAGQVAASTQVPPSESALVMAELSGWQLFYHRGGTWVNPLSDGDAEGGTAEGGAGSGNVPAGNPAAGAGTGTSTGTGTGTSSGAVGALPDGVRLLLQTAPGQSLSGSLQRDWVRPDWVGASQ